MDQVYIFLDIVLKQRGGEGELRTTRIAITSS